METEKIVEIQRHNNQNVTIERIQLNQMQWLNMKKTCGVHRFHNDKDDCIKLKKTIYRNQEHVCV
jgi:hypothetical protein